MKRISVLASLCVILFSSYGSTQSVGTFPTIQGFWKGTYSTRVGVNDELGEVCLPSSESNIEQTYTLQIENDRIVRNFEEVTRDVELDATTGGVMVERRAAQLAGTVQAYNTSSGLLRWQRDGSESSECSVLRVDADGSIVELFWRATEADAARCDELAAAHSDAQPPSCDVVERPGLVRSVDYDSVRARGTASRACLLSAWSEIGECSQSCGGGTLTRERHVLNDYGNASLCDDEPLTSPGGLCNAGPCQPCVYTEWSTSWSPCNVTCGAGTQYRTRTPLGALSAGNPACVEPATPGALPPTHETRSCQPAPPVCAESRDCVLTAWSAWAACTGRCRASASAPAPTRSRHRAIAAEPLGNGAACGALIETVACNEQLCEVDCERCNFPTSIGSPTWCRCCQYAEECRALGQSGFVQSDCVDNGFCSTRCNTPALCDGVQLATGPYVAECVLGPWSGWSPCSGGTCASDTQLTTTGTRSSHRLLVRPGTSNAPPCGELVRSESCERDCEVPNSEFDRCLGAPWSAWPSFCRCGQQRTRTRLVALDSSSNDDDDAQCAVSESQPCPDQGCARDCRYGSWSSWSACTRSCGIGLQTRTRDIVTPASENGTPCRDSETRDQRECNSVLCDIDCVLSAAVETGECSTACGPGSIPIEKRIIVGPVGRNAEPCDSLTGTRSCDLRACQPGECGAFPWSQWTACSVACGGGVQTRNRIVPAESCGEDVSSVDERVCNEKACAAVLETFADIGVFGDDAAQLEQNLPALAQALSVQEQRLADVTATSEAEGADEYRQNGGGVLRVFDAENEPAQAVVDTLLMRLASGDSSALGGVSLESGAQLSASSYEPVTTLSSPTITPGASDGPATASNTTLPVPGATSDEGLPIWIPIVIVLAVICLIGGAIAIVLSVLNARRANEEAQGVSVYGTVSRTEQLGPAADEDSSSIDEGSEIREFRRKQEARRARRAQAVAAAEKDTKKPVVEKESSNRDIVKTDPVDNSESGSGSYSYSYSYQSYTD